MTVRKTLKFVAPNPYTDRNLIPRSQYNGPVLKLTKADNKKIESLQKKKAGFELELESLKKYAERIKITTQESMRLNHKIFDMERNIRIVEDMIKEIKQSRLSKQIKKLAKII